MTRIIFMLCFVLVFELSAEAASFTALGDIAGGDFSSRANAVSDDGSVVVGFGTDATGQYAFRWTPENGMVSLGGLGGNATFDTANGVSADGSVIVGVSASPESSGILFRWTADDGMENLGDLPGGFAAGTAHAISANGQVIVGSSAVANGNVGVRWTAEEGMISLGVLPDSIVLSLALGASDDGSVIVGQSSSATGAQATVWTQETGLMGLGELSDGPFTRSYATDVTADGSLVVGQAADVDFTGTVTNEAFVWSSGVGMIGLGDLAGGGVFSVANAISADGAVIVGQGTTDLGLEAFVWTEGLGMQLLMDVLTDRGATGFDDWTLVSATGISADGNWISGYGINPLGDQEAFLANIAVVPVPGALLLFLSALFGLFAVKRNSGDSLLS